MNPLEFAEKIKKSKWVINKYKNKVFINTEGNKYTVAEVTPCAAEEIVESHNNKIEQEP